MISGCEKRINHTKESFNIELLKEPQKQDCSYAHAVKTYKTRNLKSLKYKTKYTTDTRTSYK